MARATTAERYLFFFLATVLWGVFFGAFCLIAGDAVAFIASGLFACSPGPLPMTFSWRFLVSPELLGTVLHWAR
jgi:hypothetical protein